MKYFFYLFKANPLMNYKNSNLSYKRNGILITPFYYNIMIKLIYYFILSIFLYAVFKNLIHYSFVILDFFIIKFKIFDIFRSSIFTKDKFLSIKYSIIFLLKWYFILFYLYLLNKNLYIKIYVNTNQIYIIKKSLWTKIEIIIPTDKIYYFKINQNLIQKLFILYDIHIISNDKITIENSFLKLKELYEFLNKINKI